MHPHVSIITLGVSDMKRARAFYEKLGFVASGASQESVTFFKSHGVVLALYGWDDLAEDAHTKAGKSQAAFRGISIAHNVASPEVVDAVIAEAVAAGATLMKPGQKVFWGGYSGYFADPDGHLWEVAHNPFVSLSADGRVGLPE